MDRYENFDRALAKSSSRGFLSARALATIFVIIFVQFGITSVGEKAFEVTRALQVLQITGKNLASRQVVVRIEGKQRIVRTADPYVFVRTGDMVCLLRTTTFFGRKQYSVWPTGFCPQINR